MLPCTILHSQKHLIDLKELSWKCSLAVGFLQVVLTVCLVVAFSPSVSPPKQLASPRLLRAIPTICQCGLKRTLFGALSKLSPLIQIQGSNCSRCAVTAQSLEAAEPFGTQCWYLCSTLLVWGAMWAASQAVAVTASLSAELWDGMLACVPAPAAIHLAYFSRFLLQMIETPLFLLFFF